MEEHCCAGWLKLGRYVVPLCFGLLWIGSGVGTVDPVGGNGLVWRTVWDDGTVQCCLWGSTIVMDAEDVEYLWRCLCSWFCCWILLVLWRLEMYFFCCGTVGSYCCFGVWRCTCFGCFLFCCVEMYLLWLFPFLLLFAFGLLLGSSTPVLVETSRLNWGVVCLGNYWRKE